jgi:hypothetical protein
MNFERNWVYIITLHFNGFSSKELSLEFNCSILEHQLCVNISLINTKNGIGMIYSQSFNFDIYFGFTIFLPYTVVFHNILPFLQGRSFCWLTMCKGCSDKAYGAMDVTIHNPLINADFHTRELASCLSVDDFTELKFLLSQFFILYEEV